MFNYITSGGFSIFGCSEPNQAFFNVQTLFDINDLVWVKAKAQKGVLERISIKQINVFNVYDYLYQDTFNRLWAEHELIDQNTAQLLVEVYKQKQLEGYIFNLRNCSTSIV